MVGIQKSLNSVADNIGGHGIERRTAAIVMSYSIWSEWLETFVSEQLDSVLRIDYCSISSFSYHCMLTLYSPSLFILFVLTSNSVRRAAVIGAFRTG